MMLRAARDPHELCGLKSSRRKIAAALLCSMFIVVQEQHPSVQTSGSNGNKVAVAATSGHAHYPKPGRRWKNALGMHFAPVPGTSVLFAIWETRVRDFASFADATGYIAREHVYSFNPDPRSGDKWMIGSNRNNWRSPGFEQSPDNPVVNVSWLDAKAFCMWLTERDRASGRIAGWQEYRLPTDAEWSLAVGSTKYPWGDEWPPPKGAGNYFGEETQSKWPMISGYSDGAKFTSRVGSYSRNHYGLYDMGGNVWEWCEDWYKKEMNSSEIRRTVPAADNDHGGAEYRVLRGGGYAESDSLHLMSGYRTHGLPFNRYSVGFRVVLSVTSRSQRE
jgi:formylglycine-generating enzyme required for sulfatase activity